MFLILNGENIQSFTTKYDASYVFLQMPFIRLRKFLYSPTLLSIYIMKECWIFSNAFSGAMEMIFFYYYVHMVLYIH